MHPQTMEMPLHNSYIGQVFNELADLLEIEGANPFRIRAYRNAARVITTWPQRLSDVLEKEKALPKLPGVGTDLTHKVEEIVSTGKLRLLEEEEKKFPKELITLLKIPGLGPKRVLLLRNHLGVSSLRDLKAAASAGKIRDLPGFGLKTEERILQEVVHTQSIHQRVSLTVAEQIVEPLMAYLKGTARIRHALVAGSYRRKQENVGDLDILISGDRADTVMKRFVQYEEVEKIILQGPTKSAVLLRSGIQVDLRVVPEESFGAALLYFTGSKSHNIAIRTLGVKKGLKINEYGIFRGNRRLAGNTEAEIYQKLGLSYIEPELREARGEIVAARENRLPKLVTLEDIRGDLHAHTDATDGRFSLSEMVEAAKKKGYEYVAITDHSKHLTVARGLTPERLGQQLREIDALNHQLKGFRVLKAIEVDILEDGSLDLPDNVLAELDLTVCSVHFKFDLSEQKQTERIIRAMDNPYFKILGHPTGRLIGKRPPYGVNLGKVIQAAQERNCFLEVNSQPERMDLNDIYCKAAKESGVKVSISTDSHSVNDFDHLRYGIYQARRGWLEPEDVINTLPWEKLKLLLKRK